MQPRQAKASQNGVAAEHRVPSTHCTQESVAGLQTGVGSVQEPVSDPLQATHEPAWLPEVSQTGVGAEQSEGAHPRQRLVGRSQVGVGATQ